MSDFEEHFKNRLLSVVDNSFDGIYSRRYLGQKKTCKGYNPSNGYNIPDEEEQDRIFSEVEVVSADTNHFLVPSQSIPGHKHLVDMGIGRCQCQVNLSFASIKKSRPTETMCP